MGRTQRGQRTARWKIYRGAASIKVLTAWAFKKREWIEPHDRGVNEWRISDKGMDVASEAENLIVSGHYDKQGKGKVTANDVLVALESYYSQMGYAVISEVSIAYQGERRVDALVVGRGNETAIVIEIKVSRQDFKHEIEDADKRQIALDLCSQYFFAAPRGMIETHEIPPECGLLELGADNKLRPTVEAPHRRPEMPDWRLVGSVARALRR